MSDIGNKEIFSSNLLYYIERSGKSQRDIAGIIGVSTSTFNEWVKGKKYPRIDKIEMLANYFRIEKSDLIEKRGKTDNHNKITVTDGERMLLDLFSQVPEESQQMVLDMIRIALKKK